MVYRRFRINIAARILVLSLFLCLFFFLLFRTELFAALFITAVLAGYQIYSLIRYVETTNRDLSRFFETIKYEDFSQTFKDDGRGESFSELRTAFNEVCDAFRKARSDKEQHYHYLQTVVQHIGVGLIAFHRNGDVELINTAAKRLLKVPRLKNVKTLEPFSKSLVEKLLGLRSKEKSLVKLSIFNSLGQEVRTLVHDVRPMGAYQVAWDGHDSHGNLLPSGFYYYRLQAGDESQIKRMLLIK